MPFGSHSVLADITHLICLNNAKSMLDVGMGNGINGAVYKNYSGYDRRLVGVEVFENYRNPIWGVYNDVIIGDIRDVVIDEKFDLIIMTDVLEHFTVEDGILVIAKLKALLNRNGALLISTPGVWIVQGAAHGNIHETHLSLWDEAMMMEVGLTVIRTSAPCKYGHRMIIGEYINR